MAIIAIGWGWGGAGEGYGEEEAGEGRRDMFLDQGFLSIYVWEWEKGVVNKQNQIFPQWERNTIVTFRIR